MGLCIPRTMSCLDSRMRHVFKVSRSQAVSISIVQTPRCRGGVVVERKGTCRTPESSSQLPADEVPESGRAPGGHVAHADV